MRTSSPVIYSLSSAFYLSATFLQPLSVFGADDAAKAILSLSKASCCLVLAIIAFKHHLNLRIMLSLSAASAVIATILIGLAGSSVPLIYAANSIMGASSALLLMTIASLATLLPHSSFGTFIALGFLLSTLVSPVVRFFLALDGFMANAVCYVLAVVFAALGLISDPYETSLSSVLDASSKYRTRKKGRILLEIALGGKNFIPIVGAWLLSFSYGMFESGNFIQGLDWPLTEKILVLMFVVMFVLSILDDALFQGDRTKLSNVTLFGCIAFLLAFAGIVFFSGLTPLAFSLMSSGLTFCYLAFWLVVCETARDQNLPAPFLFGLFVTAPVASVRMVGKLVPSLFLLATGQAMEAWQAMLVILSVLCVALIIAVLYLVRFVSDAPVKPLPADDKNDDPECDPLLQVCLKYGIAQREQEVLRKYAVGRSATRIAQELCLSEYTVKTYVRRIYAKLDVSNRQELIDLLEGEEKDKIPRAVACEVEHRPEPR